MTEKLKKLIDKVPQGFFVDTPWLASRQIDRRRAHYYVKNGWLSSVAQGVYRRPISEDESNSLVEDWKPLILSIQTLMGYDVHLGGKTALKVSGYSHYMEFSDVETVYLYGDAPSWLKRVKSKHEFKCRPRSLFRPSKDNVDKSIENELGPNIAGQSSEDISLRPPWEWPLKISSPERAILELLNDLPKHETFHNVDVIFEALVNLRPRLVEDLLLRCKSVKVKRLFFVFADRHNHAWRKYLDETYFNLGSGPRSIIEDGKIHPRYRISVPPEFVSNIKTTGDLLDEDEMRHSNGA